MVGQVSAQGAMAGRRAPLGVALLGNGFMAKAHAKGLIDAAVLDSRMPPVALVSICGRDQATLAQSRDRYGFERCTGDWREQVDDPSIALFHNTGPNALHMEPTIAALRNGKHVLCEKPLATNAADAHAMWAAAVDAGVRHMCGFNFRFAPAARLAYEMVQAGEIGEIVHFRAQFLESSGLDERELTWRDTAIEAGGAVADLGSHVIDLARWLVGEMVSVQASTSTYVARRGSAPVEVDDAFGALVHFASGASGVIEASRVAGGIGTRCAFEIDGAGGTLRFSSERLNDLEHAGRNRVTRRIRATGEGHPFMGLWWPHPGHAIGWGDTFTHEVAHFLAAVDGCCDVAPLGADFEDGYRCAEVCEGVLRAAASGVREQISYRSIERLKGSSSLGRVLA